MNTILRNPSYRDSKIVMNFLESFLKKHEAIQCCLNGSFGTYLLGHQNVSFFGSEFYHPKCLEVWVFRVTEFSLNFISDSKTSRFRMQC